MAARLLSAKLKDFTVPWPNTVRNREKLSGNELGLQRRPASDVRLASGAGLQTERICKPCTVLRVRAFCYVGGTLGRHKYEALSGNLLRLLK